MDVLEEVEGRADSWAEGLGGWNARGSAWKGWADVATLPITLGAHSFWGMCNGHLRAAKTPLCFIAKGIGFSSPWCLFH